jgi:hypothetical protein
MDLTDRKYTIRSFIICTLHILSAILAIKCRQMEWAGYVARMEENLKLNILVVKPEGKRPLKRTRHRWKNDNKINLKQTWYECVNWIHMAQDRVMISGATAQTGPWPPLRVS